MPPYRTQHPGASAYNNTFHCYRSAVHFFRSHKALFQLFTILHFHYSKRHGHYCIRRRRTSHPQLRRYAGGRRTYPIILQSGRRRDGLPDRSSKSTRETRGKTVPLSAQHCEAAHLRAGNTPRCATPRHATPRHAAPQGLCPALAFAPNLNLH